MTAQQPFAHDDAFARFLGIELLEVSPGRAKAQLTITAQHLNGMRMVHGGTIFTLADFVFAAAANAHDTVAVAINANISYVKAAVNGILIAEAQETSLNPKLGTYTVRVTEKNGELVAIFQGMVYRKK